LNHGISVAQAVDLVGQSRADALALHLNPLQEIVQAEGDRDFSDLWSKIAELVRQCEQPVILKETGCGIPGATAERALGIGIAGFGVSGAGGTNWGHIEGLRRKDQQGASLGQLFRNWGIPTDESIIACRRAAPDSVIIGSGGVRNGLQAAVAMALGADIAGMALPFLRAAEEGNRALMGLYVQLRQEIRGACFLTGSKDIAALRSLHPQAIDPYGRPRFIREGRQ